LFVYKALVLGFPLTPKMKSPVWTVEAKIHFRAKGGPVKVSMFLPSSTRSFAILNESFISGGYGLVTAPHNGNRNAVWSIREATGKQSLYYQASIRKVRTKAPAVKQEAPEDGGQFFQGPALAAAKSVIRRSKAKSADTPSMVANLVKMLTEPKAGEEVKRLLGPQPSVKKRVSLAVRLLNQAGVPARMVRGIPVMESARDVQRAIPLIYWFEFYHDKQWTSFDPYRGRSPVPGDWLPWWRGPRDLVKMEGGNGLKVTFTVSSRVEEAITAAVQRGQISQPFLLKFSLFSLPINTQAIYRILLLVPVGALILVLLRNVVGIKTFGTFMPVLIALSFRETGLVKGIFLFTLLVALGLAIRFYLERLKLLAVPRLAAVLIVVVGLMAMLSVLSRHLGSHTGISIALFPMVILTMTIERMSVVWEERGPAEAITSGFGSILTATIAFIVMNIDYVGHMIFVFPELLFVLLGAAILLGRYTGYRLTDWYRFRALAQQGG
ncbi:MAG: UUP1 family membrane protein, partial [Deltaproteobacteria bacterium]